MRIVRFNAVGALGFTVQLAALALLLHADVHYLAATAIAVEVAVLHNFCWHERWTFADRRLAGRPRLERLLRFHALNGAVSLAGNLVLMRALTGWLGVPPLAANAAAVAACAAFNFLGADRLVFSRPLGAAR